MTLAQRIVRAIALVANLHPVAREVLDEWFDNDHERT